MFKFNELLAFCTHVGQRLGVRGKPIQDNIYSRHVPTVLVVLPLIFSISCGSSTTDPPIFNRPEVKSEKIRIDLNSANAGELRRLPGIGEKTALKIITFRERNGPFIRIENLMLVDGISEKKFLEIAPSIEVR